MAGQPPDPRTLNSWEDAFQHPLPVVRKLEQQLRKNIDENRQKLRSLVGASYRDLLGTAERIIEMDGQMQTVETYLGDIGKKCNARTIERISENHVRMQRTKDARDDGRYRSMAQTKVLQNSLTAASRIVKSHGDALHASKLFVLSRLLHKSLSDMSEPPVVLEDLRRKLNTLRSRLLLYIEHSLSRISLERTQLNRTLCAYALVTSSSPKEVLRYFLQIRYDQLDNKSDASSETEMLRMLDLYSQTLFETRELFPRRFADALSQVSKVPLLQDEHIHSIPELNIDIYRSWIAEDVRTFTPWIRHDQLVSSDTTDALVAWAKQAQNSLLEGLQTHLQHQNDAQEVLQSRHKFISKFIGVSSKLKTATPVNAIDDLRRAFLSRLEELAKKCASLEHLVLEENEVKAAEIDTQSSSIWAIANADFDLSQGAFGLRSAILDKQHGRSGHLLSQTNSLDEWVRQVVKFVDITNEMSSTKWDDDLEFELDDIDDGDSLQKVLNSQDAKQLREKLRDACKAALTDVSRRITSAAASTQHSTFYLRTWREIELRRRELANRLSIPTEPVSLTALHQNIARSVSSEVTEAYVRSSKSRKYIALTLWDGIPPLPIQPSPHTFKYLVDLHRQMSSAGPDLWTLSCVTELKRIVLDLLRVELHSEAFIKPARQNELTNGHLETEDEVENEGEAEAEDEKQVTVVANDEVHNLERERLLQNIFDLHYLHRAFSGTTYDKNTRPFDSLIEAMRDTTQLDDVSTSRLKKSASEYWKRTYLMFGLLAPDSTTTKE